MVIESWLLMTIVLKFVDDIRSFKNMWKHLIDVASDVMLDENPF